MPSPEFPLQEPPQFEHMPVPLDSTRTFFEPLASSWTFEYPASPPTLDDQVALAGVSGAIPNERRQRDDSESSTTSEQDFIIALGNKVKTRVDLGVNIEALEPATKKQSKAQQDARELLSKRSSLQHELRRLRREELPNKGSNSRANIRLRKQIKKLERREHRVHRKLNKRYISDADPGHDFTPVAVNPPTPDKTSAHDIQRPNGTIVYKKGELFPLRSGGARTTFEANLPREEHDAFIQGRLATQREQAWRELQLRRQARPAQGPPGPPLKLYKPRDDYLDHSEDTESSSEEGVTPRTNKGKQRQAEQPPAKPSYPTPEVDAYEQLLRSVPNA